MGIPPYSIAKMALDFSGPYPASFSDNKYITFNNLYSVCSGQMPAKKMEKFADKIVHMKLQKP